MNSTSHALAAPRRRPRGGAAPPLRRRAGALLALIVTAVATFLVVTPGAALASAYRSLDEASPDNHNWMSRLPDSTKLSAMSIPGTHDTLATCGTRDEANDYECVGDIATSITQTQEDYGISANTLTKQLNAGIRSIDIRVRVDHGDAGILAFTIHHGAIYQYANFTDVLTKIRDFLAANPAETVLMNLKFECGGDSSCDDADGFATNEWRLRVFRSYLEGKAYTGNDLKYVTATSFGDLFWGPSVSGNGQVDAPTLGAVRGKIVLLGLVGTGGGSFNSYGVKPTYAADLVKDSEYIQNHYEVPTVGAINDKWELVRQHLRRTNGVWDANRGEQGTYQPDAIYINNTSGSSLGAHPATVAGGYSGVTGVNDFLNQCLHGTDDRCPEFYPNRSSNFSGRETMDRTGVVMMDFPGGELIDTIIAKNPQGSDPVPPDRPTKPGNLRWTAVTADSVSLEWDASTDNLRVTGYAIYRNGTLIRVDGTTTTYTDRNLPPDTAHTYTVRALDADGNISDESNAVTVTTEGRGETAAGAPIDNSPDDRAAKPEVSVPHSQCRPEGMAATRGVDAPYCKVYDAAGREWLGGRDKRVVGYFSGWRTGENDEPRYLVPNIPWSKVSHVNYAFAKVENNRISVGDTSDPKNPATGMTWPYAAGAAPDPSLNYKGHFNLLAVYKKRHPQVKTLISVGGWADSRNFYTMATTADGGVNQGGIDAFADSVVEFLDRYKEAFDGVDIDYEYPSALPKAGNPADWDLSDPRRKGLQKGYNALMKTLREKLDAAGAARGRYYLLTSAAAASGYLVRGYDAGDALKYQDFINLMTYDLHGSWNHFVGPQAPLYDDGKDVELQTTQVYSTMEYDKTGYFNIDWAYHYYRGALPPGRINIGIPYYTRGWQNVAGGTDGLWGTAAMPDQGQCQPGTGPGSGAANPHPCGNGAVGIDNIWHDLGRIGNEVPSGSNPLWHAKNLQQGVTPGYLSAYTDPAAEAGKMKGSYAEKYDSTLKASWLWNADKKVFLSTENNASIDAKIDYVKQNKLGGVMMWELAGDYTQRANGEYGMGYDLTTRLDNGLRGSGGYQTGRAGATTLPGNVVDVKAELVNYPTGPDPAFPSDDPFYPMRPTLRITNNTSVKLPYGTQIAFDIPTSAPPILKDAGYQDFGSKIVITKGRSGANVGGLKADFHRVTVTIGYCEDVAPGATRDIVLRHYLPLTGPANVTVKIGANTYGSTQNDQKGATTVTPVVSGGIACQAEQWQRHPYNPHGTFAFEKDSTSWRIVDWVGGNVLDHPSTWQVAHLVENQPGNQNQVWTVTEDGGAGWYRIKNRGKCLQADGILKQLSVYDCDGRPNQWWQLLRTDNGSRVTGAPVPGTGYHLAGFADTSYKVAYLAEGKNSGNVPGTPAVAGAPDGSTASTVFWNNFLWRANWWTTATDEPGISAAWTKLGPTLQKVGTSSRLSAPRSITTSEAPVPSDASTGPPAGHERDPITITDPSTKPKAP